MEQEDIREKIDTKVLNAEIEQIVARKQILRDEILRLSQKMRRTYERISIFIIYSRR